MRKQTYADKAAELIGTMEGRRAFVKAMFTSNEAVVEMLDGAVEMILSPAYCPTCRHDVPTGGRMDYQIHFADDTTMSSWVDLT